MRLVLAGQELEDDSTVGDYQIQNGNITTLYVCDFVLLKQSISN